MHLAISLFLNLTYIHIDSSNKIFPFSISAHTHKLTHGFSKDAFLLSGASGPLSVCAHCWTISHIVQMSYQNRCCVHLEWKSAQFIYAAWHGKHYPTNICLTTTNKCSFYDVLMLHWIIKFHFGNSFSRHVIAHCFFLYIQTVVYISQYICIAFHIRHWYWYIHVGMCVCVCCTYIRSDAKMCHFGGENPVHKHYYSWPIYLLMCNQIIYVG